MNFGFSLLLFLVLGALTLTLGDDAPEIQISEGKVTGEEKESREDRDFFAYRGIPYAKPPVGDLRFEPPQPPSNWSKTKDAEDYEKQCLQYDSFANKVVGQEDCLYLNVFTPKFGTSVSKKLLPVMVYIHGGFFMSGAANKYKPHYFMDHEVVVVTFNYRVGALGFLNTQDGTIRGNMGLKDQVMVLQWVQRNIRKFGGDPAKVTIFGEGAGASSVQYHMLSPMSRNLFQRAISQGGTVLNPYAFQPRPAEAALRLVKSLNCKDKLNSTKEKEEILNNSTLLAQCLKRVDAKKIVELHKETWTPLRNPLSVFLPSVETTHRHSNDTFLAEHPFSLLISGKQRRIPWMVGYNAEEGLHVTAKILHTKEVLDIVESLWNENSGKFLVYDNSRSDITEAIRQYYITPSTSPSLVNPPAPTTTPAPTARPATGIYPTLPYNLRSSIHNHSAPNVQAPQAQPTTPAPNSHASAAGVHNYSLESTQSNLINFEDKFKSMTRLFTDRFFAEALFETVSIQSKLSPVYMYYNNYQGQFSFVDVYAGKTMEPVSSLQKTKTWFKTKILGRTVQQPKHLGVCHGDELPLLFKYSDAKVKENTKDYNMSRDLVQLWIGFASAQPTLAFRNVTWPPAESTQTGTNNILQFSNTPAEVKLLHHVFAETQGFWNSLRYLAPFQQ